MMGEQLPGRNDNLAADYLLPATTKAAEWTGMSQASKRVLGTQKRNGEGTRVTIWVFHKRDLRSKRRQDVQKLQNWSREISGTWPQSGLLLEREKRKEKLASSHRGQIPASFVSHLNLISACCVYTGCSRCILKVRSVDMMKRKCLRALIPINKHVFIFHPSGRESGRSEASILGKNFSFSSHYKRLLS